VPIIKEKTMSHLSTLPAPPPAWLPPDEWPLPSRVLHIGDDTIHYIDVGKGPTILFVEAGIWSFIWRDVINQLRATFRCVALDFPGTGLSSRTSRDRVINRPCTRGPGYLGGAEVNDVAARYADGTSQPEPDMLACGRRATDEPASSTPTTLTSSTSSAASPWRCRPDGCLRRISGPPSATRSAAPWRRTSGSPSLSG
jgi:pimeloyl-ACP methyl ester carboxylesterase